MLKWTTKSIGLTNVKVSILLDNVLQHFSRGCKKISIFIKKKLNAETGMGRRYPNPSEMGMWFTFSSLLGIDRVPNKYMRIGYGNGECKTHSHPSPLLCLENIPVASK